jgi:DNA-binding response OmpR family regulator
MLPEPREKQASDLAICREPRKVALIGIAETKAASIARTLQAVGIVSEPVSAVDLSENNGFDGAIYDLAFSGLEGENPDLEALRAKLGVPVLVIGQGDDLLAGMDEVLRWADEFLPEPWCDASLVLAVSRLLSRSRTSAKRAASNPAGPLILIADDDPSEVNLLRVLLGHRGMESCIVGDGLAAISMIRQKLPDAVLLDVNMPVMNGLTVLDKIRHEMGLVRLPIALLTSYSDSARVSEALRLGANDYIVKPFQPAELTRRVTRLLSLGRTNPDAAEDPYETGGRSRRVHPAAQ